MSSGQSLFPIDITLKKLQLLILAVRISTQYHEVKYCNTLKYCSFPLLPMFAPRNSGINSGSAKTKKTGIKVETISKQPAKVTTRLRQKPRWISKGTIELLWGSEQIKPCERSFTLTLHSSIPHANLPPLLLYADWVKAPSSDTSLAFLFNTSRNLSISVKEVRRKEAVL